MEKGNLQNYDKVTLKNGQELLVLNQYLIPECGVVNYIDVLYDDIIKVERPEQYEIIFEKQVEILTKMEKEYITNLIKPFKHKIEYIQKQKYLDTYYFLTIFIEDDFDIVLPNFEKEKYYRGMELNKSYTLEDLGIEV